MRPSYKNDAGRKRSRGRVRFSALLAITVGIAALVFMFVLNDAGTRTVARYYLWKTTNANAGEGHRLSINGIQLYYEDHGARGPGQADPVLVLHGGTAFIETMGGLIPPLAVNHRVIAVDTRGHGRSTDNDEPLSYASIADDMLALLTALHVERVSIVGWSDGGIVGLHIALRHPKRVNRLVAIGANYRTDGYTDSGRALIDGLRPDAPELADARSFYERVASDPTKWPILIRKVKQMWLREPNYTDAELSKIKTPTLLVLGEHDDIRKDHAEKMVRLMPHARLMVVGGASHMLPLENPPGFDAAVTGFIDER